MTSPLIWSYLMNLANKKGTIGLALCTLLIALFLILPVPEGMTRTAMASLGLFGGALILWVLEVVPMTVSTLGLICIMPLLGIMSFNQAIGNFGISTALFIMATGGITTIIGNSTLPLRITNMIMKLTKGDSGKMVFYFGLAGAILSGFMSSLATCALFFNFALVLLKANNCEPGKSNLGRCLMIVLPACCGIGGFLTPAGTPGNIVLMEMMETMGIHITFAQWCVVGLPLGLLATLIFALWLPFIYKPEKISEESMHIMEDKVKELPPLTLKEKKSVAVVLGMIVLWFIGSWVPYFSTTVVALLGMAVMFMPGTDLLTWKEFSEDCNWNLVFVMGSVSILMIGVTSTGAMDWIAGKLFSNIGVLPVTVMFIAIAAVICVMRAFIPTTTAVIALFVPLLQSIAVITGANLAALLFIPAFWGPAALLLCYTEPIYLITFGEKYYTAPDLLKAGILPSLLLSVIIGIALPILTTLAHIA